MCDKVNDLIDRYITGKITFGEFLTNLRRELGFSMKGLAQALGISTNVIQRWEHNHLPSLHSLNILNDLRNIVGQSVNVEGLIDALRVEIIFDGVMYPENVFDEEEE